MPLINWMRRKYEQRCPDAIGHVDRIEASGPIPEYAFDDGRCSGLVICEVCGHQFYDHPPHPFEIYLNVICDGRVVKL